ncbi:SusD/RagB family nutrient-binding outer membrane lipoprotein [Dysgonomonas sp. ZJ709]|uniref:SusD/RagB family nutrient-binding outer membrane lipoprotein n=1 Tax=Dysgonomonas sp. ZJ709 TaxID=2709797 RepID=UPI0013ED7581|nr:SusD/RagB family nutrient-binding outer membrane lipoprotein [Dysgonomonas sp. ZJ709]
MKKYIFIFALILLASSSCTKDFEDTNTNKNKPETIVPNLLLPYLTYTVVDAGVGGSVVTQHLAARDWVVSLGRYDWYSTPYWDYSILRNANNLILEAENVGNDNFKGIGLIFKCYLFARTTDCVGDIPFSDALKGKEGVYMATYDKQEDVYVGLLAFLEQANDLLDVDGVPISGDILYNGDILKWKKFANSLHLRLLMRVSDKMPDAKTKIKTIVDNPAKYPIFESNDDMAALTYLQDSPNRFLSYNAPGFDAGEVVLGKALADTLLMYKDPRIDAMAQPTLSSVNNGTPEFVGVPCAMSKEDAVAYNGGRENQSLINKRYSHDPVGEKGIYMSYAELQFILAEAAQKNWISGSAKTYYENGIRGSFEYYGLSGKVDNYLIGENVVFKPSKGLLQIAVQKWISFYFNTGYEVFFDIRRTGMPYLFPGTGNLNGGKIPVRWKYPDTEQNYNGNNYKQAISLQGEDNTNTPIWLTK